VNPVWLSALAELNYRNTSVWPLLWPEVEFYFSYVCYFSNMSGECP